jgi:cyclase
MLKKRIIGVVTVKDGWCVQSFGYGRYQPLGKPEHFIENLDRWGADEILLQVIDRSNTQRGPDFDLLEKIGKLGLGTPLIYAGGVSSVNEGVQAIQLGADRLVVDAVLHDDISVVRGLSYKLGAQAIIMGIPVSIEYDEMVWFDYRHNRNFALNAGIFELANSGVVSELLVIDWKNEGLPMSFNQGILKKLPVNQVPLILFGGISESEQVAEILQTNQNVSAVAIGNFLSYREHAIQGIKASVAGQSLRPAFYQAINL